MVSAVDVVGAVDVVSTVTVDIVGIGDVVGTIDRVGVGNTVDEDTFLVMLHTLSSFTLTLKGTDLPTFSVRVWLRWLKCDTLT